ncbi:hypothetical protein TorRG33x02_029520 [Trema orientale]|uniref:Uncharacterized protein n=1 Tax=Trema orientale TaxID=63057 RepID=A0A2P5FTR7_TREOI|nr:hypothetical protein TorRG33x02_029520 [Trema orientale]
MLGRLFGSTWTQSKATRVSFSATSTGNESFSLLSIHVLILPPPPPPPSPSITAMADSISEVFTNSRLLLSNLYLRGSLPDKSSKRTTPNAYTSDSCVGTPED